jgi:phosphoglycerol transferase MdoB-like AlkP superfamily enzyme
MSDTLTYQQMGTAARGQAHALFAQTMGYVAVTAGLFALGAWAGHDLAGGVGIIAFIAAFACLIGMQFAVRRSLPVTVGLLGAFGLLIGLAVAPTVTYYGSMDPRALWERAGRRRCSSPGSAPRAMPPGATSRQLRGPVSGRWWR